MYRYIADLHIGCTNSFEHRILEHDEILVKIGILLSIIMIQHSF